ncbi:MAG: protein kinase [Planctomycetia bacterium]|nr:protein kinase [Planctomycetia bacterium]
MPIQTVAALHETLLKLQLLEPEQLAQVARFQARFHDPRALAKELLGRGYLTPYQVNQLFQGNVRDLALGPYVLLERLGEGGMGQVFKARHTKLGRTVAIKVIRKDRLADAEAVSRFRREIQASAQLSHPNIVMAYDADQVEDAHFLTMEYVEGMDLGRLVKQRGPLPVAESCEYVRQAATGLAHAHERNLVHRDVKPSNLLLARPGPGSNGVGQVKLLDLGLARVRHEGDEATSGLTQMGEVIGTPDYIAPEQARNARQADIRSDLYSLGCTFYFLLTARPPFGGETGTEKLIKHCFEEATPIEQLRPDVPPRVAAIIRKLMAKDPAQRYQTPAKLVQALSRPGLLSDAQAVTAKPLTKFLKTVAPESRLPTFLSTLFSRKDRTVRADAPERLRKVAQRRRGLRHALVGGALGLLLLVGLAVGLYVVLDDSNGGEAASGRATTAKTMSSKTATSPATPSAPRSPLDVLDARSIPPEEQFAWQPKELVALFGKHQGRLWSPTNRLAVSPDGKLIATSGSDGIVHLWDAGTHRQRDYFREECNGIASLHFSPDNQTLAVGGNDGNIYIWDAGRVQPTRKLILKGHRTAVLALAFAPNRQQLASAGVDEIKVWDVGRLEAPLPVTVGKHAAAVQALAWTHNGQKLLSGGRDKTVRFWEPNDNGWANYFTITELDEVTELALSPKNERLVIGCHGRDIYVWDLAGRKQSGYAEAAKGANANGVLSADAHTLVCHNGSNFPIQLWDVSAAGDPKERITLPNYTQGCTAMGLAANGRTLVLAGTFGLQVWNLSAEPPRLLTPRQDLFDARALSFAPDGQTLAVGGRNGRIRLLAFGGGSQPTEQYVIDAHGRPINDVKYFPDGKLLASVAWDGSVRLWDVFSPKPMETSRNAQSNFMLTAVAVSGDGKLLAASGIDKVVRLYNVAQGKLTPLGEPLLHNDPVVGLAIDPRGRYLACAARDGGVALWDLTGPRPRRRTPDLRMAQSKAALVTVAFAPDGQTLAVGSSNGLVRFWEVTPTDARERTDLILPQVRGSVHALAYSPDGALLAISYTGKVVLYDVAHQKVLRDWELPGTVEDLAFAPDSRHLALANGNGTLYLLRLTVPR